MAIWIIINPLTISLCTDIAINNGIAYFERIKSNICHGLEEPGAIGLPVLLAVSVCGS